MIYTDTEDDILDRANKRLTSLMQRSIKSCHEVEDFVNGILVHKLPHNRCVICGRCVACDEWKKEGHHPAKKVQDLWKVPVCLECHWQLTEDQKLWDQRCWTPDQPEGTRVACTV